jgi:penicillin-binding protein 1A
MSRILQKTVEEGTLANGSKWGAKFTFTDEDGKSFRMPVAGKTGTPQNWSDAWAIGYSPYYTTAIWFGFDKPGNSLGVDLTGSTLAGPILADYLREIHRGLPRRDFVRPASGIIDVTVCAKSGLLRTPSCNEGAVTLPFLAGTQPSRVCDMPHSSNRAYYSPSPIPGIDDTLFESLTTLTISDEIFPELSNQNNRNNRNAVNRNPAQGNSQNNPLLDGDTGARFEPERFVLQTESAPPPVQQDTILNPEPLTQDGDSSPGRDSGPGLEIPAYNPLLD